MPTIPYNTSIKNMIEERPEMAREMLEDALDSLIAGDVDDGRLMLRQYVNATIGFQELAKRTGKIDKNLMRSLSPDGNPTAENLFAIIRACAEAEGFVIATSVRPAREGQVPAPS